MILKKTDYAIGIFDHSQPWEDAIAIKKKALEEWRDQYRNVAEKHPDEREFPKMFYVGMANVLTDILKHFEEE